MATDKSAARYQGLILHDPRIVSSNLISKTDADTPSAYTEQGPRAGTPEADQESAIVVRATGQQSQGGDLEIKIRRAGMPGSEGCGYVWRDLAAGDGAAEFYGWDGPQLITGWHGLSIVTSTALSPSTFWPDIVRTDAGTLFCVTQSEGVTYTVRCDIYDPNADAGSEWSQENMAPTGAQYTAQAASVLQLPPSPGDENGRILLFLATSDETQIDVYKSDDLGETFTPAALRVLPTAIENGDVKQIRARYSGGAILLLVTWDTDDSPDPVAQMNQYASDDLGASFVAIVTDWNDETSGEVPTFPSVVPLDGGGFLVTYHDGQSGDPKWRARRIGTASESLTDTTPIEVGEGSNTATVGGCAWRDEDGTIYALIYSNDEALDVRPKRSTDGGQTWEEFANPIYESDSEGRGRLVTYAAETIGGRGVLLARWEVTGAATIYEGYSVAAVYLGGFTRHTAPAHKSAIDYFDTDFVTWAKDSGSKYGTELPGEAYLPIALPGDLAWSESGTGSAASLTSGGELEIETEAAQSLVFSREMVTTADPSALFAEFAIEIDDGDGDDTTQEIAFLLRFTDGEGGGAGTFEFSISVRCDSAGYKVYDEGTSLPLGDAVALDLTSRKHIRIAMGAGGAVSTWHAADGQRRQWVAGLVNETATDGGGGTDPSLVQWGHVSAVANVSRWALVGVCAWAGRSSPYDAETIAKGQTNPDDLHPRSFAARPVLLSDSVRVAAVDGPGLINETFNIEQAADYPIESIDVRRVPSPAIGWRSVDTSEDVAIVWSLEGSENETLIGSSSLGVWIQGANWRTGKLQGWNTGNEEWDDLVTLDAASGWSSLPYQRQGSAIRVDTGSAFKADHFLFRNAHAGDYFEDEGTGAVAKIERNKGGAWTDETTARPVLWCDPAKAAGFPSSGNGRIWRSSFGAIAHDFGDGYEIVRLKIDAQTTVESDLRVGAVVIGPVFVFGHQYDLGWQMRRRFDVDVEPIGGGRRVATKNGPSRRELSFSWAETALDLKQIQKDQPVPDYVTGRDGGDPIATRDGTLRELIGYLDENDGPRHPVALLQRITRPDSGDPATVPIERSDLVIYGRIETDPQLDNVIGSEGVDEVERGNTVTIVEEV